MAPINFDRLFCNPERVHLIREHGMKFATDFKIIWDIDRFPTYVREHFEVLFEDERIVERMFHEVRVTGRAVRSGPGVATNVNEGYSHYEAWLGFIKDYDKLALKRSRFQFHDPDSTPLSLLYTPLGPVQSMYLGGVPTSLLETAERAAEGLRFYYCNGSGDLIMLAVRVPPGESIGHRHIIRYYLSDTETESILPVAFIHASAEKGEGILPEQLVHFIQGNQSQPWMFIP